MDIDWAKLRRLAGNLIAFSAYLQASCIRLGRPVPADFPCRQPLPLARRNVLRSLAAM
jgi:hypothetical protein